MIVSMLDEMAWLFNLRGSDIDYNPVFFAYAVVTHDSATLYINENKLSKEIKEHLQGVKVAPYEDIFGDIQMLGEAIEEDSTTEKIFVSNRCSWALTLSLGEKKVVEGGSCVRKMLISGRSPIQDAKAVKNPVELEGMRQCHIRDGTALVEYFAWLENELLNGKKLDEVEAADKLEEFRRYVLPELLLAIVKRIYMSDYRSILSVRPVLTAQSSIINLKKGHVQQSNQKPSISVIQAHNSSINPSWNAADKQRRHDGHHSYRLIPPMYTRRNTGVHPCSQRSYRHRSSDFP